MQNSTCSKVKPRLPNSDQAEKALSSFIINEKDLGRSYGSIGKVTLKSSA